MMSEIAWNCTRKDFTGQAAVNDITTNNNSYINYHNDNYFISVSVDIAKHSRSTT